MSVEALTTSLTPVQLPPTDPPQDPQKITAVTTTVESPAPPTPVHSSIAVTDPAASATTQQLNMMQELANLAVPNENVENYLQHLKPTTQINIAYLKHELKNHPNVLFVSNLVQGFRDGFFIGFEGPRTPRFSHNLKSADEHPDLVKKNLLKRGDLRSNSRPVFIPTISKF